MKAALLISALALCGVSALSRIEAPVGLPKGWKHAGRTNGTLSTAIHFSLPKRNMDVLQRIALDVSTPSHPSYGKHLTAKQVSELTAPRPESLVAVTSWLTGLGLKPVVLGEDLIRVADVPVDVAEAMFSTRFGSIQGVVDGEARTATRALGALVLPAEVQEHIAAIYGPFSVPLPGQKVHKAKARADRKGAAAQSYVTPSVIWKRYNVTGTLSGDDKNQQAVAEFQGQWMQQSDLTAFFQQYVAGSVNCDTPYAFKGDKTSGDGIEALLDIEYIMGVSPCAKTEFWGYANDDFCADVKVWTTALSRQSRARVHSVSYGWQGDLGQIGCSPDELKDIDGNFASLASQGFSMIIASGDSGSNCDSGECWPSWPASSPWVTAVGATTDDGSGGEMATTQFGSGGGFADFDSDGAPFPQPSWQTGAVSQYFKTVPASQLPSASWYTPSGRATPDVSAYGENFAVIVDGSVEGVGGTSASTPTFAALVTRLNDARVVKNGKAPLGFLNPFLYRLAATTPNAFYDVTEGTNGIDRGGNQIPGFPAAAGWDPATGLGTPNFRVILAAVNALP